MKIHSKNGFTLIELLLVVAIIGLLSGVIIASLNKARIESRDTRRKADLKQLQIALELYYDNNNESYPRESEGANGIIGEGSGLDTVLLDSGLIPSVSYDPLGPGNASFRYYYDGSHTCTNAGFSYPVAVIFARTMESMENANWSRVCNGPDGEGSPNVNTYMVILGRSSG